MSEWHSGVRNV